MHRCTSDRRRRRPARSGAAATRLALPVQALPVFALPVFALIWPLLLNAAPTCSAQTTGPPLAGVPSTDARQEPDGSAGDTAYSRSSHGLTFDRPAAAWKLIDSVDAAGNLTIVMRPPRATMLGPATADLQISVKVSSLPDGTRLDTVLADAEAKIKAQPTYVQRSTANLKISDTAAVSVLVDLPVLADRFRLREAYVIRGGFLYTFSVHAPLAMFEKLDTRFKSVLASVVLADVAAPTGSERDLRLLAARCGSEVDWAGGWDEAAARSRAEKKLILIGAQIYRGFDIPDQIATRSMMDPDIIALVRHRFVPMRLLPGMKTPLSDHDTYGLSGSTFGTALLLVTPDGDVVSECFATQRDAVRDFLYHGASAHAGYPGPGTPPDSQDPLDVAAWHLERGDLERAERLLAEHDTARAFLLRADLARRRRDGPRALADLDRAARLLESDNDSPGETDRLSGLSQRLILDRACLLLRMSRFSDGKSTLEAFLATDPPTPLAAEATYRLGEAHLRTQGTVAAMAVWQDLVSIYPESRWAWKAAAMLLGPALSIGIGDRVEWPSEDVLRTTRNEAFSRLPVSRSAQARREARSYLLDAQREDGSWICPIEVGSFTDLFPNRLTQAITAICAHSLLDFRNDKRDAIAVRLGFEHLERSLRVELPDLPQYMDYTVWTDYAALRFFAACLRTGVVERARAVSLIEERLADLERRQNRGGGWTYYVTGSLEPNSTAPQLNLSMSFVTAAVLVALHEVREAGVEPKPAMVAAALRSLESMENRNGTFEYMVDHGTPRGDMATAPAGAAGRAPLCALALHRWGKADIDRIQTALVAFVEHRHTYSREKGKALMHAGIDGQGSHYLMFDYAFAAEAAALLPAASRARFREALLDQVLDARTADGSYLDNPMIGPHYATAMALLAFAQLAD